MQNYRQALRIIAGETELEAKIKKKGIAGHHVFEQWLGEERKYLQSLAQEPLEESTAMEYYQSLVDLRASECVSFCVSIGCRLFSDIRIGQKSSKYAANLLLIQVRHLSHPSRNNYPRKNPPARIYRQQLSCDMLRTTISERWSGCTF